MKMSSNLAPPTFPSSSWDFMPFLCAGLLALLFTALLVLLVEDAEDREIQTSNAGILRQHQLQQLDLKAASLPSTRLIGHAEKRWRDNNQAGCELQVGGIPFMNPTGYPQRHPSYQQQQIMAGLKQLSSRNDLASLLKQYRPSAINVPKSGTAGIGYHKGLLASPTSATSSTQTTPILSMAKMIMHRHDQANKRPRRSKPGQPSPPPSPPAFPSQSPMQFQQQQYSPPIMLRSPTSPTFPTSPPLSPPPYRRPRSQAHLRSQSVSHINTHQYVSPHPTAQTVSVC